MATIEIQEDNVNCKSGVEVHINVKIFTFNLGKVPITLNINSEVYNLEHVESKVDGAEPDGRLDAKTLKYKEDIHEVSEQSTKLYFKVVPINQERDICRLTARITEANGSTLDEDYRTILIK